MRLSNDKQLWIFWALLVLIHSLFLVYQLQHERLYLKDSLEYVQAADNLREFGVLFSGPWEDEPRRLDYFSKRPPVYPGIIAAIQGLFGHEKWMIILQNLLSLFNIYLIFRLAVMMGIKFRPFLLLPFLLFYPAQFIYANLIMTEILFQTLLLVSVWLLIEAFRKQKARYIWGFTACIVLGMLTKPVLYLFAWFHLPAVAFLAWKWRKKTLWLAALVPLLTVISYSSWNQSRTGYYHFSSIQNLSLLQYTTYNLLISDLGPEEALIQADSILYQSLEIEDYGESQQFISGACAEVILSRPFTYIKLHIKGMVNFFMDPGRFDLYHFFGLEEVGGDGLLNAFSKGGYQGIWNYLMGQPIWILLLILSIIFLNFLKLMALLIFPFIKQWSLMERLLILLFIVYISGLTGISGASRFALPVFPLVLLVFMLSLQWAETKWHQLRSKRQ